MVRFDQLLLEAGGAGWPDKTKITLLRNAVRPQTKGYLVGRPPSTTYEEFKQSLRDVEMNYALLMGGSLPVDKQTPTAQGDPMDLDVIQPSKTRATWVSPEVIAARRVKGACLRCGGMNHMIKTCTYAPAARPKNVPQPEVNEIQPEK